MTGLELRQRRQRRGWSQARLALALGGLAESTIRRYEAGRRRIPLPTARLTRRIL